MSLDPQPCRVYAEPEAGIAYVALAREVLIDLAKADSAPLVVLGLRPRPNEIGYDLKLRRPTIFELTAAIDDLPKTEAAS